MIRQLQKIITRLGERNSLIVIACIAFMVQLLMMPPPSFFGEPYLIAKNIVAGLGYVFEYPLTGVVGPTCYVTPLYVFLQVPILFFGLGERGIQVMNLLFLQGACFVLYFLFRNFVSREIAILIFGVLCFYVPFWILAYTMDPNTFNLLLIVLTVERLYRISIHPTRWRWVQFGILIGLQLLLRPDILLGLFIIVPWIFIWGVSKHDRSSWKEATKGIALAAVVAIAIVAPWTLRNYLTFQRFVLVSANSGMNLYEGNNWVATGEFSATPPTVESQKEFQIVHEYQRNHTQIEIDQLRFDLAESWMFSHPMDVLTLDLEKVWYHWFGRPIMGEQFHYKYQAMATIYRILGVLLIIFGFYGLYVFRDKKLRSLIMVFFVYSTMVSAIFFVQSRHRILKCDPFLLPLAIIGATHVAGTFKSRSRSDLPTNK